MSHPLWENIFRRSSSRDQTFDAVKNNILFQDLSKKDIKFIMGIVHIRDYQPQEKIFSQGEAGVGMYIVVNGCVDIHVQDHSLITGDSKDVFITRLNSGDFFGELSLIEDTGRRSATATAHKDTKVVGFFKPDLLELLERKPDVGVKVVFRLAEVLGRRLVKTTEKVSELRKELVTLNDSQNKEDRGDYSQEHYST